MEQFHDTLDVWLEANRPSPEIRPELDLGWRIEGQSVFLFEIRPRWDDPSVIDHYSFAKATYVKARNEWKVYWLRASLKWDPYPPLKVVKKLGRFLKEVDDDPHHCFRG